MGNCCCSCFNSCWGGRHALALGLGCCRLAGGVVGVAAVSVSVVIIAVALSVVVVGVLFTVVGVVGCC